MRYLLKSASDCAAHVLFDPLALTGLSGDDFVGRLEREAEKGNCIFFDSHGDGGEQFCLLVDESPNAEEIANIVAHEAGVIRIPSGELWAVGQEYVGAVRTAEEAKTWQPESPPHMRTHARVAPGTYQVDAWILKREDDYDDLLDEMLKKNLTGDEYARLGRQRSLSNWGCGLTILGFAVICLLGLIPERFKDIVVGAIVNGVVILWVIIFFLKRGALSEKVKALAQKFGEGLYVAIFSLKRVDGAQLPTKGLVLDESGKMVVK